MPQPAEDLAAVARAIVDESRYLTLATADAAGRPWASPVWFAPDGYATFLWVSHHEATHSANIAARPEVGLVLFDSGAPISTGQGLYVSARAELVPDDELEAALAIFTARALTQGGRAWEVAEVRDPAVLRLYRARATSHSVLDPDTPRGQGDHRVTVEP